jgi:hypothetical protein
MARLAANLLFSMIKGADADIPEACLAQRTRELLLIKTVVPVKAGFGSVKPPVFAVKIHDNQPPAFVEHFKKRARMRRVSRYGAAPWT